MRICEKHQKASLSSFHHLLSDALKSLSKKLNKAFLRSFIIALLGSLKGISKAFLIHFVDFLSGALKSFFQGYQKASLKASSYKELSSEYLKNFLVSKSFLLFEAFNVSFGSLNRIPIVCLSCIEKLFSGISMSLFQDMRKAF